MPRKQATVLFAEDEESIRENLLPSLEREGHRVVVATKADDAILAIRREPKIDLAVFDMQLPIEGSPYIGRMESDGGRRAGLILAGELRKRFRRAPIVFWTHSRDRDLPRRLQELGNARLISKHEDHREVIALVKEGLDGFRTGARPRTFIVHGHDEATMSAVARHLEKKLGFPPPIILRDAPSRGRTIIEKLEEYTHSVDLVFVLLTPDDRLQDPSSPANELFRSRQNVIFELGYFMAALGRSTGRVILLYRRPIELPSDISGIISIDITDGLARADAAIRKEVLEWLDPGD